MRFEELMQKNLNHFVGRGKLWWWRLKANKCKYRLESERNGNGKEYLKRDQWDSIIYRIEANGGQEVKTKTFTKTLKH